MKRLVIASDDFKSIDISKYEPSDAILDKLEKYRNRGSKINFKSIKSADKILTYYYATLLMGWDDMSYDIGEYLTRGNFNAIDGQFGQWSNPEFDWVKDTAKAIRWYVHKDENLLDTRSLEAQYAGVSDDKGLLRNLPRREHYSGSETINSWVPPKLLKYFVDNDIPVEFKGRKSGGQYDNNGAQWTETEQMVIFPDTPYAFDFDLNVHTNERADGSIPNTYSWFPYTDIRTSIKQVIEALDSRINRIKLENNVQ